MKMPNIATVESTATDFWFKLKNRIIKIIILLILGQSEVSDVGVS
jgi:hypothetical protein